MPFTMSDVSNTQGYGVFNDDEEEVWPLAGTHF